MKFNILISLVIKLILIYPRIVNNLECSREYPLFDLETNNCTFEIFNKTKHIISNEIILNQCFNKINQIGISNTRYTSIEFSSKKDLIIGSFIYTQNITKQRYFYGITSNGRSLFYDQENDKFINEIKMNANTSFKKYEYELIRINLINGDEKDYYLSCSMSNHSLEIIDFYNYTIIGINPSNLFGYAKWSTKLFNILSLNNEEKTYMFCFIGKSGSSSYLSLQKFQFNNSDISKPNSYIKIGSTSKTNEFKVYGSYGISCNEIKKYNLIQCLHMDSKRYLTVGHFSEDTLGFIYSEIIDNTTLPSNTKEIYFQIINLKNETSIIGYFLNQNSDSIYIQIKNLIYNNYSSEYVLENYLTRLKKITAKIEGKTIFRTYYYTTCLKKINDNKFFLVSSDSSFYELYIFIFDLYNINYTDLFIRYYIIPLKLYNFKAYYFNRCVFFNGYIGVVSTIKKKVYIIIFIFLVM